MWSVSSDEVSEGIDCVPCFFGPLCSADSSSGGSSLVSVERIFASGISPWSSGSRRRRRALSSGFCTARRSGGMLSPRLWLHCRFSRIFAIEFAIAARSSAPETASCCASTICERRWPTKSSTLAVRVSSWPSSVESCDCRSPIVRSTRPRDAASCSRRSRRCSARACASRSALRSSSACFCASAWRIDCLRASSSAFCCCCARSICACFCAAASLLSRAFCSCFCRCSSILIA
mmetsp:Transcript_27558/g.70197  ORF Transcript_27558/g.70197 Transcript_27558/m.70197 type:complete len:234 (-) Transcript_27558:722-1423(-)